MRNAETFGIENRHMPPFFIRIFPALNITRNEMDIGLGILHSSIAEEDSG
jgi:4-aminobutyrate aminotransferase-like enzyme